MNQTVLEILTEEHSMETFLQVLLPKILPEDYVVGINCFIRPHEGKSDLQSSVPKKMRAYPRYGYPVKVFIIHDQDSNNCILLKRELQELCKISTYSTPVLIRIACRELENWYLGDMAAIEMVYPETKASRLENKAKYRNPDNLQGHSEMEFLSKKFSKSHAAREIPKYMNLENNKSISFNHFLTGLKKLIAS